MRFVIETGAGVGAGFDDGSIYDAARQSFALHKRYAQADMMSGQGTKAAERQMLREGQICSPSAPRLTPKRQKICCCFWCDVYRL